MMKNYKMVKKIVTIGMMLLIIILALEIKISASPAQDVYTFYGTVKNANGNPIPGIIVSISHSGVNSDMNGNPVTDENGKYIWTYVNNYEYDISSWSVKINPQVGEQYKNTPYILNNPTETNEVNFELQVFNKIPEYSPKTSDPVYDNIYFYVLSSLISGSILLGIMIHDKIHKRDVRDNV